MPEAPQQQQKEEDEQNASDHPLTNVENYHAHDVLCGRGGGTNNHIGNENWRNLIAANKRLYISLPKRQKMLVAQSIVKAVRSQKPSGRFLQKDRKTGKYNDIGDQKAQDKTSQALREGAPDIRDEMREERRVGMMMNAAVAGGPPLVNIGGYMPPNNYTPSVVTSSPSSANTAQPMGAQAPRVGMPYASPVPGPASVPPFSMSNPNTTDAMRGQAFVPPPQFNPSGNVMPSQPHHHLQTGQKPLAQPSNAAATSTAGASAAFVPGRSPASACAASGSLAYPSDQNRMQRRHQQSEVANTKIRDSPQKPGTGSKLSQQTSGETASLPRKGVNDVNVQLNRSPQSKSQKAPIKSERLSGASRPSPRNGQKPPQDPRDDFVVGRFLPENPLEDQIEQKLLEDDWDGTLTAPYPMITTSQPPVAAEDTATTGETAARSSPPLRANVEVGKHAGKKGGFKEPSDLPAAADNPSASARSSTGSRNMGYASGTMNQGTQSPQRHRRVVAGASDFEPPRPSEFKFSAEKVDNESMCPPPPRRPSVLPLPDETVQGLIDENNAAVERDNKLMARGMSESSNKKSLIDMSDDEDEDDDDELRARTADWTRLKDMIQAAAPDLGRDPSLAMTDFGADDMSLASMAALSRRASQALAAFADRGIGQNMENVEMTSLSRDLSLALSDMSLSRGVSQNTDRIRERIEMEYLGRGTSLALSDFGDRGNMSIGFGDFGTFGNEENDGSKPAKRT